MAEPAPGWQRALHQHVAAMSSEEREALIAQSIRRLDRATRARRLEIGEVATLSAIADYLAPRILKRPGTEPVRVEEAVLMGLVAGYQLAVGEATDQEPDPFDD